MFSVIIFGLSGSTIAATAAVTSRWRRRHQLSFLNDSCQLQPTQPLGVVRAYGDRLDARYQQFIQEHIDPWLGRGGTRQQQLQEISTGDMQQDGEKDVNRKLGLGLGSFALAIAGRLIYPPLLLISVPVGFLLTWPTYKMAYEDTWTQKRPCTTHLISIYNLAMWFGGYFVIGSMSVSLFYACQKLLISVEDRSRQNLIDAFGQQPRSVWVRVDGQELEIPFEEVREDDQIVLYAGQIIPVDGTIIEGVATIDQQMLTGEAQPAEKTIDDQVLASTVVLAGKLVVRVDKAGKETTAAQIGEILNETSTYQNSLQVEALRVTDKSVIPMLLASAVSWPLIGINSALAMLGSNFTMGMIAVGPLGMLNFLNMASREGILIKDGRALERLQDVDTVVFDKTGTLTLEQPHVVHLETLNGMAADRLLTLAAAAEQRQTHPIARAILEAAVERQLSLPEIEDAKYEIGYGIKVWLAEQLIHVGSQRFMSLEGIEVPAASREHQARCHEQGHSLVMVAVDHIVVGGIELGPTVRPEASVTVQGLRERQLALYIISGDHDGPTRQLADELGIPGYFANTLPEHKADLVKQLQEDGHRVCFVGDGINDTIAMRTADVSISLRGATTAATDTAQVVLMDASLNQLLDLFNVAEVFNKTAATSFTSFVALSLVSAAGVFFFHFTFALVEILFGLSFLTGIGITMKPLLDSRVNRSE